MLTWLHPWPQALRAGAASAPGDTGRRDVPWLSRLEEKRIQRHLQGIPWHPGTALALIPEFFPSFSGHGLFVGPFVRRVTSCFLNFEGQRLFKIMIIGTNGTNMFVLFFHTDQYFRAFFYTDQYFTATVVINGSKSLVFAKYFEFFGDARTRI
jgi:hypothetical protein